MRLRSCLRNQTCRRGGLDERKNNASKLTGERREIQDDDEDDKGREREREKRERRHIRHTTNSAQNDVEKRKTIRERWRWRIDL